MNKIISLRNLKKKKNYFISIELNKNKMALFLYKFFLTKSKIILPIEIYKYIYFLLIKMDILNNLYLIYFELYINSQKELACVYGSFIVGRRSRPTTLYYFASGHVGFMYPYIHTHAYINLYIYIHIYNVSINVY